MERCGHSSMGAPEGSSSTSSETGSKTPLGEHVHAAVYNFGFVAAERYPAPFSR